MYKQILIYVFVVLFADLYMGIYQQYSAWGMKYS